MGTPDGVKIIAQVEDLMSVGVEHHAMLMGIVGFHAKGSGK